MARPDLAVVADMDARIISESKVKPHLCRYLPETCLVDAAVAPEKEGTEDGLRHQVQYTVEDGLRVGGDDVAAFTETPCNRVQEPEGESPDTADEEGTVDVGADGFCVIVRDPADAVSDEQQGDAAEGEVRPLEQVSPVLVVDAHDDVPCNSKQRELQPARSQS